MKSIPGVTLRIWLSILVLFGVLYAFLQNPDERDMFPMMMSFSALFSVPCALLLGIVLWVGTHWCRSAAAYLLLILGVASATCAFFFYAFENGADAPVSLATMVAVSIFSGILLHINAISALLNSQDHNTQ